MKRSQMEQGRELERRMESFEFPERLPLLREDRLDLEVHGPQSLQNLQKRKL